MNSNQRAHTMNAAATNQQPPGKGFHLIACKRFICGCKVYDAGCGVSPEAMGKNFAAMMNNGYVRWVPPRVKAGGLPRDLPALEPSKPRPEVVIIEDADIEVAWRKTREASAKSFDGDWGRSLDALESHPRGKQMADLYQRVAAERHSRQNNLAGRRIAPKL